MTIKRIRTGGCKILAQDRAVIAGMRARGYEGAVEVEEDLLESRKRRGWQKKHSRDGLWGGTEQEVQHEYEFYGWKGELSREAYVLPTIDEEEVGDAMDLTEPLEDASARREERRLLLEVAARARANERARDKWLAGSMEIGKW